MRFNRWISAAALLFAAVGAPRLEAQVTSGSIGGTVIDEAGAPVGSVQVQVTNTETGFRAGALTRDDGRYIVAGLDVGGGYSVTVRRIGFAPSTVEAVRVSLGQTARADFRIERRATVLTGVTVVSTSTDATIAPNRTGVQTTVSDSTLRRLPTLGRNFTDFVQLTPQVANAGPGLSGGGVNNRFNAIQIDGAFASDAFGLGSTGQPGGQAGGRSISILAVKEYQVLLSPFDVRQGTFGGVLINAVTQSGTNSFRGTFEGFGRNQSLTREQPYLTDFRQYQLAGALGGPIIRNKAFFFVNADIQRQRQPAAGPFLGSRDQTTPTDSITRFTDILQNQYGISAGSAGQIQNESPLTNLFGRLDFNLGGGNRLVLRHNFAGADDDRFSRSQNSGTQPSFNLTSNGFFFRSRSNQSVAQLYSGFGRLSNELILGYSTIRDSRSPNVQDPQITVNTARRDTVTGGAASTGRSQLVAGAEFSSQLNTLGQDFIDVTDNLTLPLGRHRLTLGTQNRFFKFNNVFGQNSLGSWVFSSLDSLARGLPNDYRVGVPAPIDNGAAKFSAASYSAYVQDEWQASPRLTLTAGLRAEFPTFPDNPPFNRSVDSVYNIRTDVTPKGAQLSPRLGFNWDVTGDARNQLRGGAGVFVGSPAYVWLGNAFQNSGLSGFGAITCNNTALSATATTSLAPPAFNQANVDNPPPSCAPGVRGGVTIPGATATLGANSAINVIDPDFKFPQFLKTSLGYDRRLGLNWIVSAEGLYTKTIYDVFYTNRALPEARAIDPRGRVLYGTFGSGGGTPAYLGNRAAVLNIENTTKGHTYSLTGKLERQFAGRYAGSLAYTYMQARDVASTANSTAGSNFGVGRAVSDTITKQGLARSRFEQPHRIVATASYAFPSNTDVSVIYSGQSGFAYDYSYGGNGSFGDLNADGQRNDLVYVPLTTFDPTEVRFSGNATAQQAQAAALENFIQRTPCLNEQRGRIMERNSCRTPWTNSVNVRLEQGLPVVRGQRLSLRGEVFNFLNFLNKDWGEVPLAFTGGSDFLMTEVNKANPITGANLAGNATLQNAVGVYTFDVNRTRFNANNVSSNYQVQLSLRYSF